MAEEELQTRDKLLSAAIELLNEEENPDRITARRITERAGVSLGSINYYFQSKDNLLNDAVTRLVGDVASSWYQPFQRQDVDPLTRLKQLFKETSRLLARYPSFTQISVSHALLQGEISVPPLILPLLREIFGDQKSEIEIRLVAFQLVTAAQVAALRAEAFQRYCGVDIYDDAQRDAALDTMVDNLIQ